MQICDAVAVAKILNATLVIPHLEINPVWKDSRYSDNLLCVILFLVYMKKLSRDFFPYPLFFGICSSFVDIFDVDHFINVLKDDISIAKELPAEFSWSTREYYATAIRATRVKTAPVHASANWYLENVLPVLQRLVLKPIRSDLVGLQVYLLGFISALEVNYLII